VYELLRLILPGHERSTSHVDCQLSASDFSATNAVLVVVNFETFSSTKSCKKSKKIYISRRSCIVVAKYFHELREE